MTTTRTALPLAVAATLTLAASTHALTVLVDENFDSYTSTADLNTVWTPDTGDGQTPSGGAGELIPTLNTSDYGNSANPVGIQGQGLGNFGGINEYNGSVISVLPSATESIVLGGDIYAFDDGSVVTEDPPPIPKIVGDPRFNTRQTIGLRNDTLDRSADFGPQFGLNFLEMGFWNDSTCDPTVDGCDTSASISRTDREAGPGFRPLTQFAWRATIFGGYGNLIENGVDKGPIVSAAPNWQYFQLDPALDLTTTILPNGNAGNGDGEVNILDVGGGWHRYEAVLTEDGMELSLDLFRDGLDNATGLPGVDATVEIELTGYATAPELPGQEAQDAPFTSLRVGGPSGRPSIGVGSDTANYPGVFDNIYLAIEDVSIGSGIPGDFDGDGDVDGADFGVFVNEFQIGETGNSPFSDADFNEDGFVDGADFGVFVDSFQNFPPTPAAVPEPSTFFVLLPALVAARLIRRR